MPFAIVPSLRADETLLNLNLHLQLGPCLTLWVPGLGCRIYSLRDNLGFWPKLQGRSSECHIVVDPAEGLSMVRSQLWGPWTSKGAPGIRLHSGHAALCQASTEVINDSVEEAPRQE